MGIVPTVGDVFLIPLDDESAVGGQVIAIREGVELYLAIMDQRLPLNEIDPKVATAGKPVLLTLSFDAKLFNGDWKIIGNFKECIDEYPHPAFKVIHAGIMSVESRDKTFRRPAKIYEIEYLQNRSVASAQIIEDAIRAHFGLAEWKPIYDKRRAEYARLSSIFCSDLSDSVATKDIGCSTLN